MTLEWPRAIDEVLNVGWPIILILEAGLLIVDLSLHFDFEKPASGAVLICAALLAEVFLRSSSWLHLGSSIGFNYIKHDVVGKESPVYAHWKKAYKIEGFKNDFIHYNATAELRGMELRAHPTDFNPEDGNLWAVRVTTRRIARRLSYLIAISAILGTLLWGYGHIFL